MGGVGRTQGESEGEVVCQAWRYRQLPTVESLETEPPSRGVKGEVKKRGRTRPVRGQPLLHLPEQPNRLKVGVTCLSQKTGRHMCFHPGRESAHHLSEEGEGLTSSNQALRPDDGGKEDTERRRGRSGRTGSRQNVCVVIEESASQLNGDILVAETVSKERPSTHVSVSRVGTVLQQSLGHHLSSLHKASVQDVTDHGEAGVTVVVGCQVVTRLGRHQDPDHRGQGS